MAKQLKKTDRLSQSSKNENEQASADKTSGQISENMEFTVDELRSFVTKLAPWARNIVAVFLKHRHLFEICSQQPDRIAYVDVIAAMLEDKLTKLSEEEIKFQLVNWYEVAKLGKLPFSMFLEASGLSTAERRLFYGVMRETGCILDDPVTGFFRGEYVGENAGSAKRRSIALDAPNNIWTGSASGIKLKLMDNAEGLSVSMTSAELGARLNDDFVQLSFDDRLQIAAESIPKQAERNAVKASLRDLHMENMEARQAAADALTRELNIHDSSTRILQRRLGIHRSPRAPVTIDSLGSESIRTFKRAFLDVPDSVCKRSVERTSKDTLVFELRLRQYQVVDQPATSNDSDETSSSNRQKLGRFLQLHEAYLVMSLLDIGIGPEQIRLFFERLIFNMEHGEKNTNASRE